MHQEGSVKKAVAEKNLDGQLCAPETSDQTPLDNLIQSMFGLVKYNMCITDFFNVCHISDYSTLRLYPQSTCACTDTFATLYKMACSTPNNLTLL